MFRMTAPDDAADDEGGPVRFFSISTRTFRDDHAAAFSAAKGG